MMWDFLIEFAPFLLGVLLVAILAFRLGRAVSSSERADGSPPVRRNHD